MTELAIKQIPHTERSFYVDDILAVGIYQLDDEHVVLIDSSIEDNKAKKIDDALNQKGLKPAAIINTHSHADHCGGNAYFQKKYPDIQIYASKYEAHYIEDPENEPRCFCAGAEPIQALHNKFLEAKPSRVTNILEFQDNQQEVLIKIKDKEFKIIPLPGHTPGMIGIVTPDNILHVGDALFGEDTLQKHGILFYLNIKNTLNTFDKLLETQHQGYLLYHGKYHQDIKELLIDHKNKVLTYASDILSLLNSGIRSKEKLTCELTSRYNISNSITQYTLTEACVNAMIAYLEKNHLIQIKENVDAGYHLRTTLSASSSFKDYKIENQVITLYFTESLTSLNQANLIESLESLFKPHTHKAGEFEVLVDELQEYVLVCFEKDLTNRNGLKSIKATLDAEIQKIQLPQQSHKEVQDPCCSKSISPATC